uniref:Major facilitator superfamily (MFS) profile domain-containing protein n=1 Tax=Meloidogyne javanica TaxID=6303 RepID=A0A915LH84_MELJA
MTSDQQNGKSPSAMEFGWICGANAYNRALFSQIQFAGVLIGTLTFGAISDAFGRKPVSIFALTVGIASMFATAFAPNWQFLLVCRFILGLCIGGDLVVVYTFVMEQLLPTQRMAIRGFFNWHSKGRLEQMRINERKIARLAGLPPTIKLPEHEKLSPKENSFWNLIKDKTLLRRVSVLWVIAVESVPTSLRASSVGSCSLIARIGTLIAPVLVFLNTRWPASVYLIIVLIGSINLLISWLFLIETKGINLDSVHLHEDNKQYEFIGKEEMKNLKIEENKE